MYGAQAAEMVNGVPQRFENDVEMYGAQALLQKRPLLS